MFIETAEKYGVVFRDVLVDSVGWDSSICAITDWATERQSRYISICNVHVMVTAWRTPALKIALNHADFVTPDGMPLVWIMRKQGFPEQQRVNGPDLMWRCCQMSAGTRLSVFFYGSTAATLKDLSESLTRIFPDLQIAGICSPPFRPLTSEEDEDIVNAINNSGASIVFVGLGCPKQELWMAAHKGRINAVMIGVGAAFDFHAGTVKRAPLWMQKAGLEWLHRFSSEPKRLWKRYLVTNSIFLMHYLPELILPAGLLKKIGRRGFRD